MTDKIGIKGIYTLKITHSDGSTEVREIPNTLMISLRKALWDMFVSNTSITGRNVYTMCLGSGNGTITETDTQMFSERIRATDFAKPTNPLATDESISFTLNINPDEYTGMIPIGSSVTELGMFYGNGNMMSHVKLDPPYIRGKDDIISITYTFYFLLNKKINTDRISNGGFSDENCYYD